MRLNTQEVVKLKARTNILFKTSGKPGRCPGLEVKESLARIRWCHGGNGGNEFKL